MEQNGFQEPYRDSPPPSPRPASAQSQRMSTSKPLPSLPQDASVPQQPYQDEMSTSSEPYYAPPPPPPPPPQRYVSFSELPPDPPGYPPYTDEPMNDDDVPLAHLVISYPSEAPPAYNVVVRQSFRDTLISHIPSPSGSPVRDEEMAVDDTEEEEPRFTVERLVAMTVVAVLLLLISVVMIWQVLAFSHSKRRN